jgi:hypothetical protein
MSANRSVRISRIALLLAGYKKHGETMGALVVNNTKVAPPEVERHATEVMDAGAAVTTAHGSLSDALDAEQRVVSANRDVLDAIKKFALIMFGNQAEILADFGLKPRMSRALTVEDKLLKAERAKQTRTARGTKGKRQKARIHGQPQATVHGAPTPVTAPAPTPPTPLPPATPPAPATSGPSGHGGQ